MQDEILIVADEHMIVQTVKEMLESRGYRVTCCTRCLEALEMVQQNPKKFDLVITDFLMPQMNGFGLAQELTRLRPNLLLSFIRPSTM
jgi:CheY-like chemotaxis protein